MTYEEAFKWMEDEIYRNGVFKAELAQTEIMERNVEVIDGEGNRSIAERVMSMKPTGRLIGFTISSQHTSGSAHNLLQLIIEMRKSSEERLQQSFGECITCS